MAYLPTSLRDSFYHASPTCFFWRALGGNLQHYGFSRLSAVARWPMALPPCSQATTPPVLVKIQPGKRLSRIITNRARRRETLRLMLGATRELASTNRKIAMATHGVVSRIA